MAAYCDAVPGPKMANLLAGSRCRYRQGFHFQLILLQRKLRVASLPSSFRAIPLQQLPFYSPCLENP
eukprot:6209045-Pleurochrysis_carterae.AAC.2